MGKLQKFNDHLRDLQFDRAAFLSAIYAYDGLFDGSSLVFEHPDHDTKGNICHDDIADALFTMNHDKFYVKASEN